MKIKFITICVEYDDYLAITLPRNMERLGMLGEELERDGNGMHSWTVVTSYDDESTQSAVSPLTRHGARLHVTDSFYRDGAAFNKGLAIEEAFDRVGREGWLCVMDADVLLPGDILRKIDLVRKDNLYVPRRRMCPDATSMLKQGERWDLYPHHKAEEHAGYMQLFHADSECLLRRSAAGKPWYGTHWKHAGGCDSDFAKLFWPHGWKRPAFEVMHLGPECRNWHGRCAPRLDGREIEQVTERIRAHDRLLRERGLPTHG